MFQVYTSPNSAFARLKDKPAWLWPLVIAVVANLATAFVVANYVDWQAQQRIAVEKMRERNMTEEQIEQATEGMSRFYRSPLMRLGLPLVGSLATSVVSVLFLALIYNVCLPLLGATGNFVRTLSVVATAGLVAVPSAVVHIALALVRKSSDVSTGLLLAFPGLKSGFLAVILSRIDIFAIWQLVLAGLGLKVVFDVRGSRSWWLVFAIWGVLTLVMALLGGSAMPAGR